MTNFKIILFKFVSFGRMMEKEASEFAKNVKFGIDKLSGLVYNRVC